MKHTLWLVLFLSAPLYGAQQPSHPPETANAPDVGTQPTSSSIVIPEDTTIPLKLENTISSRTAYVGQAIYCETIYPITVDNRIVIPVGSYVKGKVVQVVRPGRVKGEAQLGIRFDSITLPSGVTHALRATLSGFGGTGEEEFDRSESKIKGQDSKGQDAGRIAQTTIAGAQIGTITGATTGHLGRGLGIGSAAGAAGGLIWMLASRGKDILLPAGTSLELQLSVPLTFDQDDVDPPAEKRHS
jgi:hypothetical protein